MGASEAPTRSPGLLRLGVATGLGLGYAPVASGTFGAALGVALFWPLALWGGGAATVAGLLLVTLGGFWSIHGMEEYFGVHDPGHVVIDEIAGQFVALLFLAPTLPTLVVGFFVFRVFDVIKPYPARRLEALPGASGIIADDLVAGVYANLVLRLLGWIAPELLGQA